jgi:hypothetical protein
MKRVESYEECYRRLIAQGVPHKLADMFASRKAPGACTDREFMYGKRHVDQFENEPEVGRLYRAIAARYGVSTQGKFYMSQLADFPGDPRAWIDSKDDIRRICEQRGWGCEGIVNVQPARYKDDGQTDDGPYMVAEDIVEEEFQSHVAENPDLARLPAEKQAEYKADLRERLSGR